MANPKHIPTLDAACAALEPWILGFLKKEYHFLDPEYWKDLEQEGYVNFIEFYQSYDLSRFKSENEFYFYSKAVVRNAIRDYIIKFQSKFDISLYKLRKQLKENDQSLGDIMTDIGGDFQYLTDQTFDHEEEEHEKLRQERLSLLSHLKKSGRDMDVDECKEILHKVLKEIKK